MYYVFDGSELHYFNSKFLARLFYNVGFDNDKSPYACLWEYGFENVDSGYGAIIESKFFDKFGRY